jgi:hypothetical protein
VSGVTYDAGALIAAERGDRQMWALHAGYLALEVLPTVPAVVLTQVWRDGRRQASLSRLLKPCQVEVLDGPGARRAGHLLSVTGGADVVDAIVADGALRRGDAVVTSDVEDLRVLSEAGGGALVLVEV